MLPQPRVVGRGLDREVQRNVDPVLARGGGQGAQVIGGAQPGMNGVVPAVG